MQVANSRFQERIAGKFIVLEKVKEADATSIYNWRSGVSGKFMRQPDNYSVDSQKAWIRSRGDNEINYIISSPVTGEKYGMIGIYDLNENDQVANVGRLLLDADLLKKSNPFGLEALLLGYGYVFNTLKYRKITGDILAGNVDMVKLQKFLGMKQEGYLHRHTVINGKAEDLYIMSLFREDFEGYSRKINFLLRGFEKAT